MYMSPPPRAPRNTPTKSAMLKRTTGQPPRRRAASSRGPAVGYEGDIASDRRAAATAMRISSSTGVKKNGSPVQLPMPLCRYVPKSRSLSAVLASKRMEVPKTAPSVRRATSEPPCSFTASRGALATRTRPRRTPSAVTGGSQEPRESELYEHEHHRDQGDDHLLPRAERTRDEAQRDEREEDSEGELHGPTASRDGGARAAPRTERHSARCPSRSHRADGPALHQALVRASRRCGRRRRPPPPCARSARPRCGPSR